MNLWQMILQEAAFKCETSRTCTDNNEQMEEEMQGRGDTIKEAKKMHQRKDKGRKSKSKHRKKKNLKQKKGRKDI